MQDLFLKPRSKKSWSGGPVGVATDRDFRGSWFECRNDGLVSKKMKVFSISEQYVYNYLKLNKSLNTEAPSFLITVVYERVFFKYW